MKFDSFSPLAPTPQIEEGLALLLGLLQNPALQKKMKAWYLLRGHVLRLVAVYLNLPPGHLPPELRQQIFGHGELLGGSWGPSCSSGGCLRPSR